MADAVRRGSSPIDDDTAADFYELAMTMLAERAGIYYEIAELGFVPGHESRTTTPSTGETRLRRDRRRCYAICGKPPHDEPPSPALHRALLPRICCDGQIDAREFVREQKGDA